MKPKLLFYCQHVLGMGHLVRSREIVRGLGDFSVTFLNGGEPVEGFSFPEGTSVVQLPPIRSDVEFRAIGGDDALRQQRVALLLATFAQLQPDLIVLEMFPFGRRKFAFELLPLLEAARASRRPVRIVSSVRDILVSKRDQSRHEAQACAWLNQYFDLVLVHSDHRFQRLEETFLSASSLRCPILYTGFVAEPLPSAPSPAPSSPTPLPRTLPRIIASAGGGRVGFPLLSATLAGSQELAPRLPHTLTLFTGPYLEDAEFAALQSAAASSPHIEVLRFSHTFPQELQQADLLVSMAGYNTCMNILATGIPALVFPFTGNQNEEQTIRAQKLAALGLLRVLSPSQLAPAPMALALQAELERPPSSAPPLHLRLDGVQATARALLACLHRARPQLSPLPRLSEAANV